MVPNETDALKALLVWYTLQEAFESQDDIKMIDEGWPLQTVIVDTFSVFFSYMGDNVSLREKIGVAISTLPDWEKAYPGLMSAAREKSLMLALAKP